MVDLWRAPTDNDIGAGLDSRWRKVGLHRLRQRVVDVAASANDLTVTLRIGAAATDLGYECVLRWSGDESVCLDLTAQPIGEWPCPLPRFGLRFALPAVLRQVAWLGHGPGEAYRDTRSGAKLGRFAMDVAEMQTPYVRPQENGNRIDTYWASLRDGAGNGLVFRGAPTFDFTARPWTSAALDAARHTGDLAEDGLIHLNIDAAHQGIGSASCGPGTLPQYELRAEDFHMTVNLAALSPGAAP
jgi:beta-galactosidase